MKSSSLEGLITRLRICGLLIAALSLFSLNLSNISPTWNLSLRHSAFPDVFGLLLGGFGVGVIAALDLVSRWIERERNNQRVLVGHWVTLADAAVNRSQRYLGRTEEAVELAATYREQRDALLAIAAGKNSPNRMLPS